MAGMVEKAAIFVPNLVEVPAAIAPSPVEAVAVVAVAVVVPVANANSVVRPASVAAPVSVKPAAADTAGRELPKVQGYELPMQDLAAVAQGSGLQWVNSDIAKIAEVKAAIAAEPKPIHVPRERPALAASTESALVLVETKRDLASLPLPFEKPPA
jgi:ribonuclease E